MNMTLLDEVNIKKLAKLIDAMCEVMNDMIRAEPEEKKRYQDEAFFTFIVLCNIIFHSLKRRINKQQEG
uniref:IS982 family transposase n=1 Tax=Prevotella sp. GTC17260 TaxID=3236796 RepID=A0AB33JBA1_9BACT